jgi:O-succinylbenzoic acid--CoA ligase
VSRALEVVDGGDHEAVDAGLRRVLANEGAAMLSRDRGVLEGATEVHGADAVPLPREVPKRVALVVETSGSSGMPKRVMLSADALLASAAATESALGGPGQWLLALPTHYIAGIQVLVRSIAAGTTPIRQPPGHFDAALFAALSRELEAPRRYTSLVPAQLARLVDAAQHDSAVRAAVTRFDAVLVGGQALPPALHERALELGVAVVRTYGSSETAGGCVYDDVPIGQTIVRESWGELEIAGPSVAEGYLGDDVLTAEKFHVADGERWYRTSDGGTVVDGRVTVTGRLDNVFISGGVKVSLDRVERLVQSMPGLEGAVVVAADDERWGQVAVVVVEGAAGSAGGAGGAGQLARVRDVVIAGAGRAAAPRSVVRVDALPRLSSGKPDRPAIADAVARGAEYPARGAEYPARGAEYPARGAEYPARGAESPGRGAE